MVAGFSRFQDNVALMRFMTAPSTSVLP